MANNPPPKNPRKSGSRRSSSDKDRQQMKKRDARRKKTITSCTKGNSDKLGAESIKTRQMHSSFEGSETSRMNIKQSLLDRDRPQSKLQLQRFEEFTRDAVTKGVKEFTRDAVTKGVKGVLEEYTSNLKAYVPPGATRNAFDANSKRNRYS
uniref:Uncharacterized protein n=1 Tax=Panagrolaimus sp. ES5 TaxID=591445 RepID=A0AC34G5Q9_9BILA